MRASLRACARSSGVCCARASDGSLYYSDSNSGRIRKITPDGRVSTVAGNGLLGRVGFTEDGADALSAQLGLGGRSTIAVSSDGTVYFPEPSNHRIRKVGPDRILRTAAGSGPAGPNLESFGSLSGDGAPALARPGLMEQIGQALIAGARSALLPA